MLYENRDFFISLNSKDKDIADWITYELKRKGYKMYYQFDDFPPGSDFMNMMNIAMSSSKLTIAIWSSNYFESSFASIESRVALKAALTKGEIRLVPIKVEECEIDPLFSTLAYINLIGKNEFESQKLLISGIQAALSVGKSSDIKRKPPYPERLKQSISTPNQSINYVITRPLKILYVGNKKSSDLDLEGSYHAISRSLNKFISKGIVELKKDLNINTTNVFDVLIKLRPHIFHFSGKQDGGDIRITDENNNVTTISDIELAGFLTSFGDNIKVAIIDTCFSYNCAKSISDIVDFAIGVKDIIYEDKADIFFKTFYNALCSGFSIRDSIGQATARLKFMKTPANQIPTLFCKKTANPNKAIFVAGKR